MMVGCRVRCCLSLEYQIIKLVHVLVTSITLCNVTSHHVKRNFFQWPVYMNDGIHYICWYVSSWLISSRLYSIVQYPALPTHLPSKWKMTLREVGVQQLPSSSRQTIEIDRRWKKEGGKARFSVVGLREEKNESQYYYKRLLRKCRLILKHLQKP